MPRILDLIAFLVLAVSCLITAGSRPRNSGVLPEFSERPPLVTQLLRQANERYTAADYADALELYAEGLAHLPEQAHDDRASMLLGIGNCNLMMHRYSAALAYFKQATGLARSRDTLLRVACGRASVYRRMENYRAAMESMREVEAQLGPGTSSRFLLQAANVWRDLDMRQALTLYRQALAASSAEGDDAAETLAWNQMGFALLLAGDLEGADSALTEAFRRRKLGRIQQVQTSYYYLARLKRQQGDLKSAAHLLHRAMEEREQQVAPSLLHYERAMIEKLSGRRDAALAAFEQAASAALEWRLRVPPAQEFRTSAEVGVQQIYADYIETSIDAYKASGSAHMLEQAFRLAERSRSALFEESLTREGGYSPEYWRVLSEFRRALSASLSNPTRQNESILNANRLRLAEAEAYAGGGGLAPRESSHKTYEKSGDGFPLRSLQTKLRRAETLFSFHFGAQATYRWAVSRNRLEFRELPQRAEIAKAVSRFREGLLKKDGSAARVGSALYRMLFGGIGAEAESSTAWILSLDGPLFEVPFGALATRTEPELRYLVEERSVRLAPGAQVLARVNGEAVVSTEFVGVGDPIYNAADPRRVEKSGRGETGLPRIPASAREIASAAQAWGKDSSPVLLTGRSVNRREVTLALDQRPAILHLATHVVKHPTLRDQVLVALGLLDSGEMDYLSPTEIAATRKAAALVTLSGCGSGEGDALPGLGLFGLTRAWLISGATTVAATYWPVVDDDGGLVSEFYRQLNGGRRGMAAPDVAEALRAAQIAMRQSGTSKADPAYWAAYFVLGKD